MKALTGKQVDLLIEELSNLRDSARDTSTETGEACGYSNPAGNIERLWEQAPD